MPSKFLTTPQTTATAATAAYSQTNQSVPPQAQSASVPQLPSPASQVQSASGLASIPPSAQQNTSLTPVYVQQSQTPSQQPTTQQTAPTAPSQVYYPTTPQAMVVPPPQHHYPQPQATTPAVPGSQVVQIDQGLLALQQVCTHLHWLSFITYIKSCKVSITNNGFSVLIKYYFSIILKMQFIEFAWSISKHVIFIRFNLLLDDYLEYED